MTETGKLDAPFVHVPLQDLEVLLAAVEGLGDLTDREQCAAAELTARADARRDQLRRQPAGGPLGAVPEVADNTAREQGRARVAIIAAAVLKVAPDDGWHARSRVVAAVTPLLDSQARQKHRSRDGSSMGSPVTSRVKQFLKTLETYGDAELRIVDDQAQFRLLDRSTLEHCVASGGLWPRRDYGTHPWS
jgi:hypothetical protein